MKKIFILAVCSFIFFGTQAQELEVSVNVAAPPSGQISGPKVFQAMETAIQNFMNTQQWTGDGFNPEERIKVTMQINISGEPSDGVFQGDLQIQAVRPVFGTDYETVLLTHKDNDIRFNYEMLQAIEYTENSFNDNLSALLSFYAYYILGLDYDSFSAFGGEQHFQTAQNILNLIPRTVASSSKGWLATDGNRNRFWMIENMLSPRMKDLREAMYDYHRKGLDAMSEKAEDGKAVVLESLRKIFKVNKGFPNSMTIQMFANAKSAEIIQIFKVGELSQKTEVISMMQTMDAARSSEYRKIKS